MVERCACEDGNERLGGDCARQFYDISVTLARKARKPGEMRFLAGSTSSVTDAAAVEPQAFQSTYPDMPPRLYRYIPQTEPEIY
jgi:hypothetical protein